MGIRSARAIPMIALPVLALVGMVWVTVASRESTLGGFTTTLLDRSPEQAHNIELAASKLNGKTVRPGEAFSLNTAVGQCTSDRGFVRAPTIVRGELSDEVGGGICQVSSTLYNAALLAGMEIVERHAHTSPARSVPPGRDATVSFGDKDLRFRNTRRQPVTIRSEVRAGRLFVRIVGTSTPGISYRVIVDTESPHASGHVRGQPQTCTATVWREATSMDGSTRREFVSWDRYVVPE